LKIENRELKTANLGDEGYQFEVFSSQFSIFNVLLSRSR